MKMNRLKRQSNRAPLYQEYTPVCFKMPRSKPTAFMPYIVPVRQINPSDKEYPWEYSHRRHSDTLLPAPIPFRVGCGHAETNSFWKQKQHRFAENGVGFSGYADQTSPGYTSSSDRRTRIFYPTSCQSDADQQIRVMPNLVETGMGCHDPDAYQRDAWQSMYQRPNHIFPEVMFRRQDSDRLQQSERIGRSRPSAVRNATYSLNTAPYSMTATTTTVTTTSSAGANTTISTANAFTAISTANCTIPVISTATEAASQARRTAPRFEPLVTTRQDFNESVETKRSKKRQKAARSSERPSELVLPLSAMNHEELHFKELRAMPPTKLTNVGDERDEENMELEYSNFVKRNRLYEGTIKLMNKRMKKKKEERSKEAIACKIFGLLCLQGSRERRYEISVEELRRRVSAPEHLNKVDMISYLRLAKNSARQLLEKHDIISSLHHRLSKHTVLSKVSERECEELANGIHDINMSFFPFEVTAKMSISNAKKSLADSSKRKQYFIKRLQDLEATRSILMQLLSAIHSLEDNKQMKDFESMTHTFGIRNLSNHVMFFNKYFEEETKTTLNCMKED